MKKDKNAVKIDRFALMKGRKKQTLELDLPDKTVQKLTAVAGLLGMSLEDFIVGLLKAKVNSIPGLREKAYKSVIKRDIDSNQN